MLIKNNKLKDIPGMVTTFKKHYLQQPIHREQKTKPNIKSSF